MVRGRKKQPTYENPDGKDGKYLRRDPTVSGETPPKPAKKAATKKGATPPKTT